jgi:dolichyl-diphosphooligosaccharide--protein glycosyltransferase
MLSMRRFAYYYAVNVALLSGYIGWLVLQYFGFMQASKKTNEVVVESTKKRKLKKSKRVRQPVTSHWLYKGLGLVVVFFLVFFPNIGYARSVASDVSFVPSDGWYESLEWLRENSPEPYGDSDFYYESYSKPFKQPETLYGVTAWWDYGYWIARISQRVPVINPGSGNRRQVAQFFISQDEKEAEQYTDEKKSAYVIIDYESATPLEKFHAIPAYAGKERPEFYDVYYQNRNNQLYAVWLYYPEYYRSMIVRLYNFDGQEVIPQSATVISYVDKISEDGIPYKLISGTQSFPDYESANKFVKEQQSGNFRVVGTSPYESVVSLEAITGFELIYSSTEKVTLFETHVVPEIKIFRRNN